MSTMMAARCKRGAGKPPEEKRASSSKKKDEEKQKEIVVENTKDTQENQNKAVQDEVELDFPFKENEIPIVKEKGVAKGNLGSHNRVP